MLGSDVLDAATGLFLVYFLFSALCSAINEWIMGHLFHWRAEILERSLTQMLGDQATAQEFFSLPLIQSLVTQGSKKPSYISSSMFVDGLLGLIASKAGQSQSPLVRAAAEEFARNPQKIVAALDSMDKPALQSTLQTLLAGAGNIEDARKKLESWFDESMTRASGWYKRHVQTCMIVLALVVVVLFNVDTFTIARTLLTNSTLRATVAATAAETVKQASSTTNATPSITKIQEQVKGLDLPIGWPKGASLLQLRPGEEWSIKIWSWLLTVGALSLGAPFWFDVLSKVVNLRASGAKPQPPKPQAPSDK